MNTPTFHIIRSHPIHWNGRDYEARYCSDDDQDNAWFALCSDPDDSDSPEFPEIDECAVVWPAELLPHAQANRFPVRMHDRHAETVRTVTGEDECRGECERSSYRECVKRGVAIAMGATVAKPMVSPPAGEVPEPKQITLRIIENGNGLPCEGGLVYHMATRFIR